MTDRHDVTTDPLVSAWRSAEFPLPPPEALSVRLQQRVESGTRRMVLGTWFEVLLTALVFGAIGLQPGAFARRGSVVAWGLAVLHAAAIWAFTLWNRRGIWKPFTADTAAFRALLAERARRAQRAARFAIGVVVTEVLAAILASFLLGPGLLAWITRRPLPTAALGLFLLATVAVAARAGRAARRELEWLGRIEREAT